MTLFKRIRTLLYPAAILVVLGAAAMPASAAVLIDGNSVVNINTAATGSPPAGMTDWIVGGRDYLSLQWFWYRIGDTGPEQSIDTLGVGGTVTVNQTALNQATTTYTNATIGLEIAITYTLLGGALVSDPSDIAESIRIKNLTTSALDVHFFQYTDFDLDVLNGDNLVFGDDPGTTADDGVGLNSVRQTSSSSLVNVSETTVGPPIPKRFEGALFNATLAKLNDADADSLSNSLSSSPNPTIVPGAPGDMTWAYQWDFDAANGLAIGAGATRLISKDKQLTPGPEGGIIPVPEPAAIVVWSVLGFVLGSCRWLKKPRRTAHLDA